MNSTEEEYVSQKIAFFIDGLQYSMGVINEYFLVRVKDSLDLINKYSLYLVKEYLSQENQKHAILVTIFMITLSLVFIICSRKKKGLRNYCHDKSLVQATDSNVKMNWNVFDLAKSAYEPGHTEAVIRLVEKYAYDVNYMMPASGLSLFLCACLSGEKRLIQYFIDKGADVHVHTRDGDSPLYLATFGILNSPVTDVEVLTNLVKAGCGVNTQNAKGYTPLHRAAAKGNKEVIRCLIKLGADVYLHTKAGVYPMDSAINSGHLDAAELLKIKVDNPHVWEVVDPHTPPRIQLGLQSPVRKHLIESTKSHRPFHKVFTF